jgi:hypothetical protein
MSAGRFTSVWACTCLHLAALGEDQIGDCTAIIVLRSKDNAGPSASLVPTATFRLKRGYNNPNPGGDLWLPMWGPLGAGFSKNSAAVVAAYKKLSAPGPGDSSKDTCFRCCSCRPFVASAAITGLMHCARFRRSSGRSLARRSRRLSRATQSPIVALLSRRTASAALRRNVRRGYTG